MLDIKRIREDADAVKARLALRHGGDEKSIDELLLGIRGPAGVSTCARLAPRLRDPVP
jgi:hypothetical protein